MKRTVTHGAAVLAGLVLGFAAHQIDKHPALQNFIDREAIAIRALGFSCGVERWPVKTLADNAAGQISWAPQRTTIPKLVALPSDHPSSREAPTETTDWSLQGTHIVAFKQESDSDIHIELRSPLLGNPTMIAEIPDPSCVTANSNPTVAAQQQRIGTARAALLRYALAKGLTLSGSYQTVDWPANLTGVGFFDFDHGQNGVAPNAVELHPVLAFQPTTP